MSEITQLLNATECGDSQAADQLLELVYGELRRLAAQKLAQERPGQTLDATGLVHEAYLRLVKVDDPQHWNGRGHFFGAAAEAMRRILIEKARRRARAKHGGEMLRTELQPSEIAADGNSEQLLALNDALDRLAQHDPKAAELVKLRYFTGLTIPEAAEILDVSPRKADFLWSFARAWLRREIEAT